MSSRLKKAEQKVAVEIGPKPSKNGKPKKIEAPPGAGYAWEPPAEPQSVDVAIDQIAGIADLKRLGTRKAQVYFTRIKPAHHRRFGIDGPRG